MLKLKVLIKLLNSRSFAAQQGLSRAAVWFAEGDIWGRRGSVGGKQSREHQSHSPSLDKPSSSGLQNPFCNWVHVHRAALGGGIHKDTDELRSDPPAATSKEGLGAGEAVYYTYNPACGLLSPHAGISPLG